MPRLVVHGGAWKDFVEVFFVSLLFLAVTLVSACSTPELAKANPETESKYTLVFNKGGK